MSRQNSITEAAIASSLSALNLDALTDVTITTPALNQRLYYNGSQWVNQTPSRGEIYWQDNTTVATPIVTINVPEKILGTAQTSGFLNNFTAPVQNRLTYTGTATITCQVSLTISSYAQSKDRAFEVLIYKNGVLLPGAKAALWSKDQIDGADSASITKFVSLATNDYLEGWCVNLENTSSLTAWQYLLNVHQI